jgi:O-succinylhomoserine sulfhydrylase
VRAAVERSQYGENSEALYLTSGYVQPTAEAAARRFAGDEEGYTYGRYGNPTVTSMEIRLAAWRAPKPPWARPRACRPS